MSQQVFKLSTLFLFLHVVFCSPPQEPIRCTLKDTNCTIINAFGSFPDLSTCRAAEAFYPTTEEEIVSIVAAATRNRRKIKVATRSYHGIPKLACPDGQDGLLISTRNLNRVVKIDKEAMKMTVEPGMYIRDVVNKAAEAGLALPCIPYWWGLTIGGVVSTAAHGSSLWGKGSAVHEYVVGLRIVSPACPEEGYAKVRTLEEGDEDLKAATVSLGVLGVVSQITLQLQPLFKRSITYVTKDDSDLGDQAASFGYKHEFGDITWYPAQRTAIYRIDDRVSVNATGNGAYDSLTFRPMTPNQIAARRATDEIQESTGDADGKCANVSSQIQLRARNAYGLINNGTNFTGYPVIGYNNLMAGSGSCLNGTGNTVCAWDPRFNGSSFYFTTYSIRLPLVKNFIEDVKKLVQLEPKSLCALEAYGGILLRYIKASNAYLGKPYDVIDFDTRYFHSTKPMTPRLFEDILEEIEQIAVFKYGGFSHWGKNRNVAFEGAIKKYKNSQKFLKVKSLYDPLGLFSNKWTDQIFGLKKGLSIYKDGCAFEGLCVCSKDSHCAPNKGYFCKPGKVYKEARVCTKADPNGLFRNQEGKRRKDKEENRGKWKRRK